MPFPSLNMASKTFYRSLPHSHDCRRMLDQFSAAYLQSNAAIQGDLEWCPGLIRWIASPSTPVNSPRYQLFADGTGQHVMCFRISMPRQNKLCMANRRCRQLFHNVRQLNLMYSSVFVRDWKSSRIEAENTLLCGTLFYDIDVQVKTKGDESWQLLFHDILRTPKCNFTSTCPP